MIRPTAAAAGTTAAASPTAAPAAAAVLLWTGIADAGLEVGVDQDGDRLLPRRDRLVAGAKVFRGFVQLVVFEFLVVFVRVGVDGVVGLRGLVGPDHEVFGVVVHLVGEGRGRAGSACFGRPFTPAGATPRTTAAPFFRVFSLGGGSGDRRRTDFGPRRRSGTVVFADFRPVVHLFHIHRRRQLFRATAAATAPPAIVAWTTFAARRGFFAPRSANRFAARSLGPRGRSAFAAGSVRPFAAFGPLRPSRRGRAAIELRRRHAAAPLAATGAFFPTRGLFVADRLGGARRFATGSFRSRGVAASAPAAIAAWGVEVARSGFRLPGRRFPSRLAAGTLAPHRFGPDDFRPDRPVVVGVRVRGADRLAGTAFRPRSTVAARRTIAARGVVGAFRTRFPGRFRRAFAAGRFGAGGVASFTTAAGFFRTRGLATRFVAARLVPTGLVDRPSGGGRRRSVVPTAAAAAAATTAFPRSRGFFVGVGDRGGRRSGFERRVDFVDRTTPATTATAAARFFRSAFRFVAAATAAAAGGDPFDGHVVFIDDGSGDGFDRRSRPSRAAGRGGLAGRRFADRRRGDRRRLGFRFVFDFRLRRRSGFDAQTEREFVPRAARTGRSRGSRGRRRLGRRGGGRRCGDRFGRGSGFDIGRGRRRLARGRCGRFGGRRLRTGGGGGAQAQLVRKVVPTGGGIRFRHEVYVPTNTADRPRRGNLPVDVPVENSSCHASG